MMYNYPFFSFSPFRRHSSYYNSYPSTQVSTRPSVDSYYRNKPLYNVNNSSNLNKPVSDAYKERYNNISNEPHGGKSTNITDKHFKDKCNDIDLDTNRNLNSVEPFFEIFGLQLYYDDILLVGLLFFLYEEKVKDQYIFIALILLLLS